MRIWADGDSLQPEIRSLLCRRTEKEALAAGSEGRAARFDLVVVAAKMPPLPAVRGLSMVKVEGGLDAADDRLVTLAAPGDLAVTRDTVLAERLAEKGLHVLNDRGDVATADNARERRSHRDAAAELRSLGLAAESPRARSWGRKELKAFADALDRELSKAIRKSAGGQSG